MKVPRVLVAGLRGGSGKTLVSLGLLAAWRRQDVIVAPFKKGPDYIDSSWLGRAAGRPCRNLDLFLHPSDRLLQAFAHASQAADVSVIEGNRGLFDGMDAEGRYSTAALAHLLKAPVLLSVDITKTTRTAAALVLGCLQMDPELTLGGVVLNRCGGTRHEEIARRSIEGTCGIPVLGSIPRLSEEVLPERHLGLVPPQEWAGPHDPLARIAKVTEECLDLKAIMKIAASAGDLPLASAPEDESFLAPGVDGPPARPSPAIHTAPPRIGVFRDAAFQFYYPENLESLVRCGGSLVEISPLEDPAVPAVDALYLGGGFPETLAVGLSENTRFAADLREAVEAGLPVYAECGGAVYLGERLHYDGESYAMAGVLPVEFGFQAKPKGHGYAVLETVGENPFFSIGESVRGHEFHYTFMLSPGKEDLRFAFRVLRGYGFDGGRDGLCHRNVLASYTHLHALGTDQWAPSLLRAARRFRGRS
jgi:cobyrinic acid a,c-diamide synthase